MDSWMELFFNARKEGVLKLQITVFCHLFLGKVYFIDKK